MDHALRLARRRVVVAGVQDGVWPDLRLRGSLLGSEQLVDVLTGRGSTYREAQAAVRTVDTAIGRLLDALATRGTTANVVVLSDHGMETVPGG